MAICKECKRTIRFYGYCGCQSGDGFSTIALTAALAMIVSVFYVFIQWYSFGTNKLLFTGHIINIVKTQEKSFIDAFHKRVQNDPTLKISGWKCEVVNEWGLVTYHYTASSPDTQSPEEGKAPERRAYFWGVNTRTKTVHRLSSLKQFVDDYLLPSDTSS